MSQYPTPYHARRQSIIEQAEEAHEAAVARVDRLRVDLAETEVRLTAERIVGNPLNVLGGRS